MIGNDWDNILENVWKSEGFNKFMNKVKEEYKTNTCYPEFNNIFNALKFNTPPNEIPKTNNATLFIIIFKILALSSAIK